LTRDEFELVAQEEFDSLPEPFRSRVENVMIVVEETDSTERRRKARVGKGAFLLGLYEGVPLLHRGTEYGAYPVLPDRITLFQKNIESVASTDEEIRAKIREVLIHEIGHHFGMSEREIRNAGY
jgi:predicted Zn-dependent protease with MMP-like domain